jgi:hypothetical protein
MSHTNLAKNTIVKTANWASFDSREMRTANAAAIPIAHEFNVQSATQIKGSFTSEFIVSTLIAAQSARHIVSML